MKKQQLWFLYALVTTLFWGAWGAFSTIPESMGIPGFMSYIIWSVTMLVPGIAGFLFFQWKISMSKKAVFYGLLVGLTGAGGQLVLLSKALQEGPAHLIFPIISLSPLITIALSVFLLKEKTGKMGIWGIALAIFAMLFLSITPHDSAANGIWWFIFSLVIFLAWGIQAYLIKLSNQFVNAESIFFYMVVSGLLLVPFAFLSGGFAELQEVNTGGVFGAFGIQLLNSIGALCLVYAFRYGKAIVVSPLTNAVAPAITVVLSLIMYRNMPTYWSVAGMVLAFVSAFIFAVSDSKEA